MRFHRRSILAFAVSAAAVAAPARTIQALGSLGGGTSFARGINEAGTIVGEATLANGQTHAFYWQACERRMEDLGTRGGDHSMALAINNRGLVTGTSKSSAGQYCGEGVVWDLNRNGAVTVLPDHTPGFMYNCSQPLAINDAGVIAGVSNGKAVRWVKGKLEELKPFVGGDNCLPTGINEQGVITGQCNTFSGSHGFLWKNGVMIDIGSLGGGFVGIGDINNAGQVAGYGETPAGQLQAFLYRNGTFSGLQSLGGYANARALSENGLAAGEAMTGNQSLHAVSWDKQRLVTDLGALPGSNFSSAFAINSAGAVAGVSYIDTGVPATSGFRAVLWK